jgi:hypothetical protein
MRVWRLATPLLALFAAACVLDSSGLLFSDADDDGTSSTTGGFGGQPATTGATGGTTNVTTSTVSTGGQGGASTSGTGGDGGGIVGWSHRMNVTVQALTAPVGTGYSVHVDLLHQQLVGAGQALASGDDVYVVHDDGTTLEVIDRVVDPSSGWNQGQTRIWFETRAPIAAGASDGGYWIYFGNPAAIPPPSNPNEVFLFFDDFSGAFGWTQEAIGSGASGTAATMNGNLRIQGQTGEIFYQDDSFYFARLSVTNGDVAVRARVLNAGGTLPGYAVLGGVMIRQTNNDSTRFILATPAGGAYLTTNNPPNYPANRASTYRLAFENNAAEQTANDSAGLLPVVVEAARYGNVGRSRYANDGLSFVQLGTPVTFTQWNNASYLAGIAFANGGAGTGFVDVDWFLARAYVDPEPTTALGTPETGPFTLP